MGNIGRYQRIDQLPERIPVLPLTGGLLLPRTHLPLNIFEPRYLALVDAALAGERVVGLVQPNHPGAEHETANPDLARVGCAGRITELRETEDGRYVITLSGICRFAVEAELVVSTPFRQVKVSYDHYSGDLERAKAPDLERRRLFGALQDYLEAHQLEVDWESLESARSESLINTLAVSLPLESREKQGLLLAETLNQRAQLLLTLLEMARSQPGGQDSEGPLQ